MVGTGYFRAKLSYNWSGVALIASKFLAIGRQTAQILTSISVSRAGYISASFFLLDTLNLDSKPSSHSITLSSFWPFYLFLGALRSYLRVSAHLEHDVREDGDPKVRSTKRQKFIDKCLLLTVDLLLLEVPFLSVSNLCVFNFVPSFLHRYSHCFRLAAPCSVYRDHYDVVVKWYVFFAERQL